MAIISSKTSKEIASEKQRTKCCKNKMRLIVCGIVLIWMVVALVKVIEGTNSSFIFASKIKDCIFLNNNNESVELKCDYGELHSKDDCYSTLFINESNNTSRLNVKNVVTGQCRFFKFDNSLSELFPNLITLNTSFLGIENPISGENVNFKHLKIFNASNNQLKRFEDFTFVNVNHLDEIDFSHNKVKSVLRNFLRGADSLTRINLAYNAISYIHSGAFEDLKYVEMIDLNYNELHIFDVNIFANNLKIREINIQNNQIELFVYDKDNVPHFNSLLVFNLAGNRIVNQREIIKQDFAPSLQVIDLSYNDLGKEKYIFIVCSLLQNFHQLQHVRLRGNELTTFDFNAFTNPNELRSIDLSQNMLSSLTMGRKQFINLESLNLYYNSIIRLDGVSIETFPKLASIDITMNYLSCAYATEFVRQWDNLTIDHDVCDQKKHFNGHDHGMTINSSTTWILISLSSIGVIAIVFAVVAFIHRDKFYQQFQRFRRREQTNKEIIISNNQREEIYCEIDQPHQAYSHLVFDVMQSSKIQNHYDKPISANRTS